MPSPRLVLPASSLLVLGLCWSLSANPTTERPPSNGVVTKYVTPISNFSLDKLVGRWYVPEAPNFVLPEPNLTEHLCLVHDFYYDDNGTLVVDPFALMDGVRSSPHYTFPVNENGGWTPIWYGVSGEAYPGTSMAVVHVDDRFLALAAYKNNSFWEWSVLVRHPADADRQTELQELRRRLTNAGIHRQGVDLVKIIEPCRTVATGAPDLSAQNEPSTPDTERKARHAPHAPKDRGL